MYLAPIKKIKMNRFLKVLSSLVLGVLLFACDKDDDNTTITPPRPYGAQYEAEKDSIENYLKTHLIAGVDADYNVNFLPTTDETISIWNDSRKRDTLVSLNGVNYKLYYLILNQGVGEKPTKYDNVKVAYRGTLLDNTQFDIDPYPQGLFSLAGYIEGWREIIPKFNAGILVDSPGNPNPAQYENFGAGIMFLPSDFGYYETSREGIPAYSPLIFSFKLLDVEYADHDGDTVVTRDETDGGTNPGKDTDNDGNPDYLDIDDDGDGYTTLSELQSGLDCDNDPNNAPTIHMDPNCHPEQ